MLPARPTHYTLLFEPDLSRARFTGQADIEVRIPKPLRTIELNAAELSIRSASVLCNGERLPARWSLDAKREQLTLTLPRAIRGAATLSLSFAGEHNDRLVGFYLSRYRDHRGRERRLVTTQFEAADARRCFPCWDEPAAKASFDVTISAPRGMAALSNMPVSAQRTVGSRTLFSFQRTPVMPTYLLYLAVGDFESIRGRYRGAALRVITTPGKKLQGALALRFAKQFLAYFERAYGIRYPLPKLDLIALPDFASGAMENWGAITFRETALLYDPKTSSVATKQRIAEVVAHELAHQWFGNLVTMRWWNDLWLNESFATFMATKAVDAVYPSWDFWDQFLSSDLTAALSIDALRSSHPIEVNVNDPSEIREIFDEISYEKGASVLRMLERFLGEAAFFRGIRRYLSAHRYGNATTADLWRALAAASGKPVRRIMDTWTSQTGYPLVRAHRRGNRIALSQERFLLERAAGSARAKRSRWAIPLTIASPRGASRQLMSGRTASLRAAAAWYNLNAGQTGLYRVHYDDASLRALRAALPSLGAADRWGLVSDAFSLAVAGRAPLRTALALAETLARDRSFLVAAELSGIHTSLWLLTAQERSNPRFAAAATAFFRAQYQRLGWDPKPAEKQTDRLLRSAVIASLGRLGDPEVRARAAQAFAALLKTDRIHPDLRLAVYAVVAWNGDARTHTLFTRRYRAARSHEERARLLAALASFQQPALLKRTLRFALSKDVRLQDLPIPIARLAGNPAGAPLLWPWIRANWRTLDKRFGHTGSPLLNRILKSLSVLADARIERELAAFFRKPTPGTEMSLAQTRERIRINAAFLTRLRKEFP